MSQTVDLKLGMPCQRSVRDVNKVLRKSEVLSFRRRPRKSNNPCRAWTNSVQDEFRFRPLNLVEKKVQFKKSWGNKGKRTIRLGTSKTNISLPNLGDEFRFCRLNLVEHKVQFKKSWGNKGKRTVRLGKSKTNISLPNLDDHQHHNQEPLLKEKLTPSKKSCKLPSCEVKTRGRKIKITFKKKVDINVDDQGQVMPQKPTDACPPSSEQQQQQYELPLVFKNYIKELGATGDPVLIIQKRLTASDVNRGQQRLLIPVRQVVNHGFLTEEERSRFNSRNNREGIDAILIEPSLAQSRIKLKKWYMNTSENYALVRGWNEVVKRNGLKLGQLVQLWSFKNDLQLYFFLIRL